MNSAHVFQRSCESLLGTTFNSDEHLLTFLQSSCARLVEAGRLSSRDKSHLANIIQYLFSATGNVFRSQLELTQDRHELLESSFDFVFVEGFMPNCDRIFRNGCTDWLPLEDLCYSIWDLPCGLGSCFSSQDEQLNDYAFGMVKRLLDFDHVLIQESAVKALGLRVHLFPERCIPLLESTVRKNGVGHPLADYAKQAIVGF